MTTYDYSYGAARPAFPHAPTKSALVPQVLLVIVTTTLAYSLLRNATTLIAAEAQSFAPAWLAVITALTAAFAFVRYDPIAPFARRFGRAAAIFLGVYFISEPFTLPAVALPEDSFAVGLYRVGRWLGLALAVAAWFRPAAAFASAMTLWFMRDLQTPLTGFYYSDLDIKTVLEVITFVAIGAALVGAARQFGPARAVMRLEDEAAKRGLFLVFCLALGAHLGNYFHSAIAKLMLDGGPLSWLFGNRLDYGLLGAIEKGTFPFVASPVLTELVIGGVKAVNLPLHLFSFAAQFAAIIAIWRRRWVMALTVVYDLFHIIVYVTFGLIFWKWIALNSILLATLATIPDAWWTRSARLATGLGVLLGAVFFKTATLAWYDAPGFMSPFFEVETTAGERLRAPNAYFETGSYQISQGRLYAPADSRHFNHSIWGSVLRHRDLVAGVECRPPPRAAPPAELYGPIDNIARYVWTHHDRALARSGPDGRRNFKLYAHHHMPSPFFTTPFDALDKRDIAAYYFVLESVCLSLENGALKRDVIARSEYRLPRPAE